ncbi:MAG: alpha-L-arabinofuranosidase C-terminal domain-containing protein, partial [Planctomycetota bacterium]
EVLFRVPPEGGVKIVLFFIGYGRGTGRAWFDDVRLEPTPTQEPPRMEIDITRRAPFSLDPARPGPAAIDVKQGGQFLEPLCGMLPAAIAQQVANDSFEDEPPYRVAHRKEVDQPHRPWYPSGAVHVAKYAFDTERPFNGKRSQRIEIAVPHARAGISQDGFYTKAGVTYRLTLHLRGVPQSEPPAQAGGHAAPTGPAPQSEPPAQAGGQSVGSDSFTAASARNHGAAPRLRAALHADGYIAGPVELAPATTDWTRLTAVLRATRDCENATLTLDFAGPGAVWLDRVYLIGDDAVCGLWRPDFVAALKDLNCGILRFGGSTIEVTDEAAYQFNWRDCVGPWDTRPPYPVLCWGGMEANFAALTELVDLARHVGAEPLLCVRWSQSTPAEAAAQVEYFNGGPETPMGKRRAQHGHPEPYRVKYWQIGNEVGGDEYNRSLAAFAQAMRAVDPSIKLISSWGCPDLREFGGSAIDYTSDHHYGCQDLLGKKAILDHTRAMAAALARSNPARPVRLAVTEWNTTAGDWGHGRASLLTLGNALACARYHNLIQRYADIVEITNRSNLVDSFCSGIIQTGPGWLYLTPTYYAQQLYSRAAGSYPLELHDASGVPWPLQEPDIAAAISADGRMLRIYAVNSTDRAIEVPFALKGVRALRQATLFVLKDRDNAVSPEVLNERRDPARVATRTQLLPLRNAEFRNAFPPFSLTLLELELE